MAGLTTSSSTQKWACFPVCTQRICPSLNKIECSCNRPILLALQSNYCNRNFIRMLLFDFIFFSYSSALNQWPKDAPGRVLCAPGQNGPPFVPFRALGGHRFLGVDMQQYPTVKRTQSVLIMTSGNYEMS